MTRDWHNAALSCVRTRMSPCSRTVPWALRAAPPNPSGGTAFRVFLWRPLLSMQSDHPWNRIPVERLCPTPLMQHSLWGFFWWQVNQVSIKNPDAKREGEESSTVTLEGDSLSSFWNPDRKVGRSAWKMRAQQAAAWLGDKNHKTGSNSLYLDCGRVGVWVGGGKRQAPGSNAGLSLSGWESACLTMTSCKPFPRRWPTFEIT